MAGPELMILIIVINLKIKFMELPVQLSKFKLPMSWGIILVLLMLLFLQRECQRCPKCPEEKVITKTVVILTGDKVQVFIPTKAPKPVYIDTGSYHIEYKEGKASKIDTLAIIKDYLSKYYYNDTIKDTSFVAIIKEVLYKNRIIDRQLYVQNLRQKIVNTTTVFTIFCLRFCTYNCLSIILFLYNTSFIIATNDVSFIVSL